MLKRKFKMLDAALSGAVTPLPIKLLAEKLHQSALTGHPNIRTKHTHIYVHKHAARNL